MTKKAPTNTRDLFDAMSRCDAHAVRLLLEQGADETLPYDGDIIWDKPFATPIQHLEFLPGDDGRIRELFVARREMRMDYFRERFLGALIQQRFDPGALQECINNGGDREELLGDAAWQIANVGNAHLHLIEPLLNEGVNDWAEAADRALEREHWALLVELQRLNIDIEDLEWEPYSLKAFGAYQAEQQQKLLESTTAQIEGRAIDKCQRCGRAHVGMCRL